MQQSAGYSAVAAYCVWAGKKGKGIMKKIAVWIGLVATLSVCGCALQDDVYTLDHRLTTLERRNLDLEKQNRDLAQRNRELTEAKQSISDAVEGMDCTRRDEELELRGQYASLAAQVQALSDETRSLSGRFEEVEYLLQRKFAGFEDNQQRGRERMDRLAADMASLQQRIAAIDRQPDRGGRPAVKTPARKPVAKPAAGSAASDADLYQQAKTALDKGDLQAARQGFQTLIASFPGSSHADNAQFWIGETYYREKWYEKAILEYQKVIEKYPSGNKIPAALLKQGLSFLNIGEANNARLVLKELVAKHPDSSEAGIAKKKLESM
jgi:tol-pal system protein YbgF